MSEVGQELAAQLFSTDVPTEGPGVSIGHSAGQSDLEPHRLAPVCWVDAPPSGECIHNRQAPSPFRRRARVSKHGKRITLIGYGDTQAVGAGLHGQGDRAHAVDNGIGHQLADQQSRQLGHIVVQPNHRLPYREASVPNRCRGARERKDEVGHLYIPTREHRSPHDACQADCRPDPFRPPPSNGLDRRGSDCGISMVERVLSIRLFVGMDTMGTLNLCWAQTTGGRSARGGGSGFLGQNLEELSTEHVELVGGHTVADQVRLHRTVVATN